MKLVFLRALVRDRSCSTFDGMLQTTPVMQICQTANRVSSSLWCAHRELLFSIVASQTFFNKTKMLCLFFYDTLVLPLNVTWYTGVPWMQNPNGFNSVPLLLSAVIAIRHHCYQIPASISLQSSAETCCTIFITPIDFYFTHSYIFTYLCEYTTVC